MRFDERLTFSVHPGGGEYSIPMRKTHFRSSRRSKLGSSAFESSIEIEICSTFLLYFFLLRFPLTPPANQRTSELANDESIFWRTFFYYHFYHTVPPCLVRYHIIVFSSFISPYQYSNSITEAQHQYNDINKK